MIAVHESCVHPEQFFCPLVFRKILQLLTCSGFPASSAVQQWLYDFEIHLFTLRATEGLIHPFDYFQKRGGLHTQPDPRPQNKILTLQNENSAELTQAQVLIVQSSGELTVTHLLCRAPVNWPHLEVKPAVISHSPASSDPPVSIIKSGRDGRVHWRRERATSARVCVLFWVWTARRELWFVLKRMTSISFIIMHSEIPEHLATY